MKCTAGKYTFREIIRLPPCGGSGLKSHRLCAVPRLIGLPPCGGSGLKFPVKLELVDPWKSPSMRREWIEISERSNANCRRTGLPPCGGSGLKCRIYGLAQQYRGSPSMRREWIEIQFLRTNGKISTVSLHAEGVD